MKLLFVLMLGWNIITFLMMGLDKMKVKADRRRISEKTLLTSAFVMGGIGIAAGALVFHHKTRKILFKIGIPLALIVNAAVIYGLFYFDIV